MLTYNRTLPSISEAARKNWRIRQINPEFRNVFVNKQIIAFERNKNIQDHIGGHLIKDGKVSKRKLEKGKGKSKTCNKVRSALCCLQVVNTNELSTYWNVSYVTFNMYVNQKPVLT